MLNKSDPDIQRWMANPKSQPVVYVYEQKSRTPCGSALKNGNLVNYNFTIPYGKHCNVQLTDLVGVQFVRYESHSETFQLRLCNNRLFQNVSKNSRMYNILPLLFDLQTPHDVEQLWDFLHFLQITRFSVGEEVTHCNQTHLIKLCPSCFDGCHSPLNGMTTVYPPDGRKICRK